MTRAGDPRALLPRDKFDIAALERIRAAGYPTVAPILDDLVDWTADGNWPVARPTADFLVTLGDPVVAPLARLLRGSDGSHKAHCLRLVVRHLPREILAQLEADLRELAERPSDDDRREEADIAARDALERLDR